ncbi:MULTISPECIES: HEPN domain-containing protein [unclassified Halomonas]|uniref:ApeA N-terminal domain 1-containing protein n=1 Tax=unclassified Halomonas TaxID=2609666 RepID=UPI001C9665DB|nr:MULTISPECIES: HEPN domain-containing protein [unclassified Halomonas]MBY5927192.1 hypothetical protein [Halomonas sp. DP4Y7-2]MBY6234234.1 hypothetical protein [Halomonas sp. DP4Y7-1]
MNVLNSISTSGKFWVPGAPEDIVYGVLKIGDGGECQLEVSDSFPSCGEGNSDVELPRILGVVEDKGNVTLDQCFYVRKSLSIGSVSTSTIHVRRAICNGVFEETDVMVDSLQFSMESLEEWFGFSGFDVDHDLSGKSCSITYNPVEEVEIELHDNIKLFLGLQWTLPGSPNYREIKLKEKVYFDLRSPKAIKLDDLIELSGRIAVLVSFMIGKVQNIKDVVATSKSLGRVLTDGSTRPLRLELYYQSLPYVEESEPVSWHEVLLGYKAVQDKFPSMLLNWLEFYDKSQPSIDLLITMKMKAHKYLDSEFLSLAQCLESYHRANFNNKMMEEDEYISMVNLIVDSVPDEYREFVSRKLIYGNEPNLSKRVKEVLGVYKEFIGSSKKVKSLARNIVTTRNYLTHFDDGLKESSAQGYKLWKMCRVLEDVLHLEVLRKIGVSDSEIEEIVGKSHRMKNNLAVY